MYKKTLRRIFIFKMIIGVVLFSLVCLLFHFSPCDITLKNCLSQNVTIVKGINVRKIKEQLRKECHITEKWAIYYKAKELIKKKNKKKKIKS